MGVAVAKVYMALDKCIGVAKRATFTRSVLQLAESPMTRIELKYHYFFNSIQRNPID